MTDHADANRRGYSLNTERIALEILAAISVEHLSWREICDRWGINRNQWELTFRHAVRDAAKELGLRVPRPVPDDGYKYHATDIWHNTEDAEPQIREGYLFRLQDEYTRRCNSLDLLNASLTKMEKKSVVAERLMRVRTQERAVIASMEAAAEAAEITLVRPPSLQLD